MARMKKKYSSGEATSYVSRNKALRKLQLSLADFRRLSILKGIYPVEPKNRKNANKGVKSMKTFYFAKDIKFLSQEPVMEKFRQLKIFARKLKKAQRRKDWDKADRVIESKPIIKLDHIIKERYPQFNDAVNDLDDCLCLVFLYATFPIDDHTSNILIALCRQLYFEFLHYVMASRSLRKCFISIKGYYFQADICGQNVTWILPHKLCHQPSEDIDARIVRTFLDFYMQMLGFVNFKLYADHNMIYPPQIKYSATLETRKLASDSEFFEEMFASMMIKPEEQCESLDVISDPLTDELMDDGNEKQQLQSLQNLKSLFNGCKFYLGREVPREIFTFAIRCFGGLVSWDESTGCGSTYPEEDFTITHQIIDRPEVQTVFPNRIYIQPQWVFDCINNRELILHDHYIPGANLPPHCSPFVSRQAVVSDVAEIAGNESQIDIRLLPSKLDSMNAEELKLREMMIPRKLKRIYKKAVHGRKQKRREIKQLADKKQSYEEKKTEIKQK